MPACSSRASSSSASRSFSRLVIRGFRFCLRFGFGFEACTGAGALSAFFLLADGPGWYSSSSDDVPIVRLFERLTDISVADQRENVSEIVCVRAEAQLTRPDLPCGGCRRADISVLTTLYRQVQVSLSLD